MDLEKGGGKNENYDNAEALENYYFEHKKAAPATTKSGKAKKPET